MDRHDGGELDNVLHHDDSHASDCNGSKSIDTSSLLFKEICPPSSSSVDDPTALPMIPVYTASVPSFQCASLLKQLSLLFPKQNDDVRLSHWKRVQRIDKQHNHKDNNNEIHKEKGETTEHQQAAPVPLSMNNIHHHNGETSEKPILKRLKISSDSSSPPLLRVLIASVAHLQETLEATSTNTTTSEEEPSQSISSPTSSSSSSQSALLYQQLQQTFPCLQQLEIIHLPGRPPQSVEEYQQWNQTIWPCTFYPLRVEAAAAAANSNNSNHTHLTLEQVDYMQFGMHAALEDLHSKRHASNHDGMRGGAIIMRPPTSVLLSTTTGAAAAEAANVATKDSPCSLPTIIARSTDEYHKQQQSSSSSSFHNPLSTSPIVLALQGVSRLERQAAMGDGMNHPNFQKGQYLCTGYDLFTTMEPTVMEAMACVHARVRQVVFGVANPMGGAFVDANALSSTTTTPTKASSSNHPTNESTTTHNEMNQGLFLHALPGTNHRYKVYACHPGSELWQKCHQTTERLALSTNHAGA